MERVQPLVSVIIPVYNGEKFIQGALRSVLNQPCGDFEIIVVNDGSTDATQKICETEMQKDKRIKVIKKENAGVSDTRNRGISEAAGKYIAFLDADDLWAERAYDNKLEKLLAEGIYDILCFNTHYSDFDKNIIRNVEYEQGTLVDGRDQAVDSFWHHFSSYFYKKELIVENAIRFNPNLKYYEDELFRSKALYCAHQILSTGTFLLYYRANPNSTTCLHRNIALFEKQKLEVFYEFKKFFFETYKKRGEPVSIKNLKTVQYFILALKGLAEIGYGYKKLMELCENEPVFQMLKSGGYPFTLEPVSESILNEFIADPHAFYIKHRLQGFVHNTLAETKHRVIKAVRK